MTALLEAREVAGGYGSIGVVHGVSLTLRAGRCTALLGPNGAGKSTLLRLVSGVLPLSLGTVELLGRALPRWRRREVAQVVGFVPQAVHFAFPMTVSEVVWQGRTPHLGPWRPPAPHDAEAVERALRLTHLEDRTRTSVQHLSVGERQRVILARALASEPRVLLLDEPAASLDVRHQLELVEIVRERLNAGVAVLVVLHDWNLALRLADEVLVLREGRPHAHGEPEAVIAQDLFAEVFGVGVELVRLTDGSTVVVPRSQA